MTIHAIEPDIPTLTDIIEVGDDAMKNHFDGHAFDDGDEDHDRPEPLAPVSEALRETVELMVQDALNEQLPVIEEQLKQQLTERILEKLAERRKR